MTQPSLDTILYEVFTARLYMPAKERVAACEDLATRGYLRRVQEAHQTGYAIAPLGYEVIQRNLGYKCG